MRRRRSEDQRLTCRPSLLASSQHATSRELENKLSAERQARLNISDKLDSVQKVSLRSRRFLFVFEADPFVCSLRCRPPRPPRTRLPPFANAWRTSSSASQTTSELCSSPRTRARRRGRRATSSSWPSSRTSTRSWGPRFVPLLQGADPSSARADRGFPLDYEQERGTTANFAVFKDTLLARLRSLGQLQSTFEKKIKTTEAGFVDKLQ